MQNYVLCSCMADSIAWLLSFQLAKCETVLHCLLSFSVTHNKYPLYMDTRKFKIARKIVVHRLY